MSLAEMNIHVMMCSDAQYYDDDMKNMKTSSDSPTKYNKNTCTSKVRKKTSELYSTSHRTENKRKLSPVAVPKEGGNSAMLVGINDGIKTVENQEERMKLRRESTESLTHDSPAKRALELILLDHLSPGSD